MTVSVTARPRRRLGSRLCLPTVREIPPVSAPGHVRLDLVIQSRAAPSAATTGCARSGTGGWLQLDPAHARSRVAATYSVARVSSGGTSSG